jgi:DHA2 family multidrug resistance protein
MSAAAAQAAPQEVPVNRLAVTASVMLAVLMQTLDTTIANVALPHMQGSLQAAQDQITWVLTSYIVSSAIVMPMTGWLAARFGRRRLLLIAVAGFTLSSMLCGAAVSLEAMVGARLLQGMFGAGLVPLAQALMIDLNPPHKRASAMAVFGAGIMLGPILGPTLGGWLTDAFDWRWVFYINVPVGALAFAGISAFVRDPPRGKVPPFDTFGFLFLALGIGAVQMLLDRGEQQDWFASTEILIEAGLAVIGIWVFAVHAATTKHPFLNPALLADRNFVVGTFFSMVLMGIMFGTLALMPALLASLGYPVLTAGLILSPRGMATMAIMIIIGRVMAGKVDIRIMIATGLLVNAAALWDMSGWTADMGSTPFVIAGIIQGAGMGLLFVPINTLAFSTLRADLRAEAAGVSSLARNIGGSIGISAAVFMLTRNMQVAHADLAANVSPFNPLLRWQMPGMQSMAQLETTITRQAAMVAYIDDFKAMMIVCLCAIPLLLLIRKPPPQPGAAPPPAAHAD